MTALAQYRRLEATALWHETPEAQRREVLLSVGEATLVISAMTEDPLSHWSLPAIVRLNPGETPALYAPGRDAGERLELEDATMIAALETVRGAIDRRRRHPGRLRLTGAMALGCAGLLLAALWLPGALTRQTVTLLPEASRAGIAAELSTEIARMAGGACAAPRGQAALERLSTRVFGADAPRITILPSSLPATLALPDGALIAAARLVEDHRTPEVLAGHLLAEALRRQAVDPMLHLLDDAGLAATFRLLTTGDLPPDALRDHAALLLARPRPAVPDAALIARFDAARISPHPYALAREASEEGVLESIAADPARSTRDAPLLGDADWVGLREICAR